MSERAKLRIGWVGCGHIGEAVHLVNFQGNPDCEVVAIADARFGLATKVAQKHGIPAVFPSHSELLSQAEVDAVVAILPPSANAIVGCDVLEAGKDLFVEKPMSTSLSDAERMAEAAGRHDRILMVAFMKRYDPGVQKARALLEDYLASGTLGAPFYVHAYNFAGDWIAGHPDSLPTDEDRPALPGTAAPGWLAQDLVGPYHSFNNMCSHNLNLLRYLMGCEPQVVGAEIKGETVLVRFDFRGVLGALVHGWVKSRRWLEEVWVYFEKGWVKASLPPPLLRNVPAGVQMFSGGDRNELTEVQAEPGWSFKREADHFVDCCLSRKQPLSSGEDSLADMRLLEAMFRYIQDHR